jgi:hypothetical protein
MINSKTLKAISSKLLPFGEVGRGSIHFVGIILLATALPLSMFLMSVSQIILLGNWIVEGKLKEKFNALLKNKKALSIISIYLLHLIGLLFTSNFQYALDDLRIKLPLLILPIIFATSPKLSSRQLYLVFSFFIASIAVVTAMAMYRYMHINPTDNPDSRDLITSISHIRFGLMIAIALFILAKCIVEKNTGTSSAFYRKPMFGLLLLWFICFLFISEAITAIVLAIITLIVLASIFIFQQKKLSYKLASCVIILSIPLIIASYLQSTYKKWFIPEPIHIETLEKQTALGNLYHHNPSMNEVENGQYVQLYVCMKEMREEWNKRSKIDFDAKDKKGQSTQLTLLRFLTSKNYRKDAEGVKSLSGDEVIAIENGTANVMYMNKSSFSARVHQILWEINMFRQDGNPNAHSLLQRIEYMKAAMGIIRQHPIIGVGTGDVRDAFHRYYEESNSRLWPQWRHRAHNQYLSMGVAFGAIGMVWFVLCLVYPLSYSIARNNLVYITFFVIISFSMLSEDTLETQAGVTLFAFFQCLLLLASEGEDDSRNTSS